MAAKPRKTSQRPPGVKQPADHQKGPRIRRVKVTMDDVAAQDLEDALDALQSAQRVKNDERDRRVAVLMQQRRETADPGIGVAGPILDDVRALVDTWIAAELAPLEDAVAEARARVEAGIKTYTFQSLGNTAYQRLLGEHKAQESDHEEVKSEGRGERALYHAETFGPALVQRCASDPKLSVAEVADMFTGGDWNLSELALLFMAAYEVNTQRRVVPG